MSSGMASCSSWQTFRSRSITVTELPALISIFAR